MGKGLARSPRQHGAGVIDAIRAPNGGLIGSVYITGDLPPDNAAAALDAFMEHGGC